MANVLDTASVVRNLIFRTGMDTAAAQAMVDAVLQAQQDTVRAPMDSTAIANGSVPPAVQDSVPQSPAGEARGMSSRGREWLRSEPAPLPENLNALNNFQPRSNIQPTPQTLFHKLRPEAYDRYLRYSDALRDIRYYQAQDEAMLERAFEGPVRPDGSRGEPQVRVFDRYLRNGWFGEEDYWTGGHPYKEWAKDNIKALSMVYSPEENAQFYDNNLGEYIRSVNWGGMSDAIENWGNSEIEKRQRQIAETEVEKAQKGIKDSVWNEDGTINDDTPEGAELVAALNRFMSLGDDDDDEEVQQAAEAAAEKQVDSDIIAGKTDAKDYNKEVQKKAKAAVKQAKAEAKKEKAEAKKAEREALKAGNDYTIQKGDTLFKIAQEAGVSVSDIMKANPQIKDKNKIVAGRNLKIPTAGIAQEAPETGNEAYHIVQKGDSLWKIANAGNMTVAQLKKLNPQLKSNVIYPGQKIVIGQQAAASTQAYEPWTRQEDFYNEALRRAQSTASNYQGYPTAQVSVSQLSPEDREAAEAAYANYNGYNGNNLDARGMGLMPEGWESRIPIE